MIGSTVVLGSLPSTATPKTQPSSDCRQVSTGTCIVAVRIPSKASLRQAPPKASKDVTVKARLAHSERARKRAAVNALDPDCASGYYNPDRWTACSGSDWGITEYRTTNGVRSLIGRIEFHVETSASFDVDGSIGWELAGQIQATYANGSLATGLNARVRTGCYGSATNRCNSSQSPGDTIEGADFTLRTGTLTDVIFDQYYSDSIGNNQVFDLDGQLGLTIIAGEGRWTNPVTLEDKEGSTLYGRCDNASNRHGVGCIADAGFAYVLYDAAAYPLSAPVVDHVIDAITLKPSHYGRDLPLTRTTNESKIRDNRNIACGAPGNPAPDTCDEYPLASSNQGGNGVPVADRSTRGVPKAANDSQGGQTGSYFDFYRILDGDRFYVNAYRADGSNAW